MWCNFFKKFFYYFFIILFFYTTSIDVESHSASTQSMQSLTHIDSVVGVTIPCWLSVQNVKQMNTEFFVSINQPGYESGDQVSRKKTVLKNRTQVYL
jgi:hypothetical protein